MCWLYCPSVPGSADSTSGCLWPNPSPEPFVMSRGKPMPLPSLSRAWKTKPWIRRLSGLTCAPSTADAGVGKWIASLPATPVNRSPSPASAAATKTLGTSGPECAGSLVRCGREPSSSKTSAGTYVWEGRKSSSTYTAWATALRRACLLRRKSAPRTAGSGGSASQATDNWPTPDANVFQDGMRCTQEEWDARRLKLKAHAGNGNGCGTPLAMASNLWVTPQTPGGGGKVRGQGRGNELLLPGQAEAVSLWATPLQADAGEKQTARSHQNSLMSQSYGPQVLGTLKRGQPCPVSLNPLFVEWLMGLPVGWTACAPVGTGPPRYRRRMRTELSRRLSDAL